MSAEGNPSRGWRRQGGLIPQTVFEGGEYKLTFKRKDLKWIRAVTETFDSLSREDQKVWQKQMATEGLTKTFGSPIETEHGQEKEEPIEIILPISVFWPILESSMSSR